jgi:zinc protease
MTRFLIVLFLFCASPLSGALAAAEVKEVVSPKGFTAWLVEEHALPLVAVKIAFRESGVAHDPEGKEGRANIAASVMMEGAGDLPSRQFYEALESLAIQLDMSADEDDFMVALECLSEHKDKAFSYMALALTQPRFDNDAMERVRTQAMTALIQQEQSPGYKLHRAWRKLAFGDHPYNKPDLGTKESVLKLSTGDLNYMRQHYLTKENIVIAAVGDITPQELSALLDKYLGDLPVKYDPDVKVKDVEINKDGKPVAIEFDIPQTLVAFGTQGLKRNDPDYFTAYVMNQILGGGGSLTARLGNEIREKRGLAYSVYSHTSPMTHAATWEGGFATRTEQVETAKEVLISTLKDFIAKGPSDLEMNDAKEYLTGSFVLNLDSNADIASFLLSMQLNHLGRDYLERRNQMVSAVTKEGVHALAKRLIDPEKLLIATVGKSPPKPAEH